MANDALWTCSAVSAEDALDQAARQFGGIIGSWVFDGLVSFRDKRGIYKAVAVSGGGFAAAEGMPTITLPSKWEIVRVDKATPRAENREKKEK